MANVNPILRSMITEESSQMETSTGTTEHTTTYNHKIETIKLRQTTELAAYLRCCYLRILPRNENMVPSALQNKASSFMERMRPFY
jgi:desulfoferrodoxin (superoxide reductase-like protein)